MLKSIGRSRPSALGDSQEGRVVGADGSQHRSAIGLTSTFGTLTREFVGQSRSAAVIPNRGKPFRPPLPPVPPLGPHPCHSKLRKATQQPHEQSTSSKNA